MIFKDPDGDLVRSRKLIRLSTIIHFGAELSLLPAIAIPALVNGNMREVPAYLLGSVSLNAICQPIAFYMKAKAMTPEGNHSLATYFANEYNKNTRKGRKLLAFLDRKLVNLHMHYARKNEHDMEERK
jgi:hypothetical protein